ncbi:hypothetical protein TOT_020000106 [Theileria orientalis strain Shintoku]|uniref:Secreted protein n=1 Tax=Theileria orientalis strain Shintoku TaxID=869250 RepID=J4D6Y9_THEOR|nr:hypothetical protein TOT_020000106 [Theileria orientalis strain Shintoku]PVC50204.1 hypothetical protein MACL_00002454 [Theileria orientalis]BAM39835.1 hypothetical protein TOT_020000106 [Theileria orientalis strain Shintoku]|eukprot:XP_009690136.1 hypothetical protein TOT_020000106 [Theileria orientalis strain Shintoku]
MPLQYYCYFLFISRVLIHTALQRCFYTQNTVPVCMCLRVEWFQPVSALGSAKSHYMVDYTFNSAHCTAFAYVVYEQVTIRSSSDQLYSPRTVDKTSINT